MSDPLANYYNGLGITGMTGPNPYLEFTGQIPMAGYAGTPTNAQGQPIQSYVNANNAAQQQYQQQMAAYNAGQQQQAPGTTLNSPAAGLASMMSQPSVMNPSGNVALGMSNWGGFLPPGTALGGSGSYQPQQAPAAAPPAAPNMRQAYLQALANPGPLPTYGAQMQPGATPTGTPQPSVLAQFLAAHPSGGTTGAGGYSNKGFFNTLAGLQQAQQQQPGATT